MRVPLGRRTRRVELLEQLVVLPPHLGPFCKLVLTARRIEIPPGLQILGLELALLSGSFRRRNGQVVYQCPELEAAVSKAGQVRRSWKQGTVPGC